jgi:hypothetical protein
MSGEILYLTLMKVWYDQIKNGTKKVEYREIKPYWTKRLFNQDGTPKQFKKIEFKNGYSKNAPKMQVEYKGIKTSDKYEIQLGEVLC